MIDVPTKGANGVILCQGGRFGGWSLYVKNDRPMFAYNWLGLEQYVVRSTAPLPAGKVTLRYVFLYDGGKPGAGGTQTIYVNGKKVAQGHIGKTQPNTFSLDDAADVGLDLGTPVSTDYPARGNAFTGHLGEVKIHTSSAQLTPEQTQKLRELNDDTGLSID